MAAYLRIPKEIHDSIYAIVDYSWSDEEEDYCRLIHENGGETPNGHVYEHLKRVQTWLDNTGTELPVD